MKSNYFNSYLLSAVLIFGLCPGCKQDNKKLTISILEMKGKGPGWGHAVVIQTPGGHVYLFDTGSNYPDAGFDAGKDMIAPFLEKNSIKKIDGVLISHSHNDHFGGFQYLMNNFEIKHLYDGGYTFTSDPEYDSLYKPEYISRGGVYSLIKQGDTLNWDKDLVSVILSPPQGYLKEDPSNFTDPVDHHNPNLNSIVLRMKYKKNVFLFVGDINSTGQEYLLKQFSAEELKTTVLCLGHGGAFLPLAEVVKPEIVVESCLNGVEQPSKEAKKVYNQVGSKVYATCWNGTVQIVSDGINCTVTTERNDDK
jgi:competence protein ComEC